MMSKDWRLVINLANSICGVALLALPHCFSQCGVVLGSLLLVASAYLTIQSCKLLVKVIFHTECFTYEKMALQLFGTYGKVAMEISSTGLLLGTCSAFFVIVTDLAPVLVANLVDADPFQLRLSVSFLLGLFVVFPLCLLKRLESLSYLSAVSLIFYASLAVQLLFLSMDNMSNEETLQQVELWRTSGVFNIVPIFALAFSCHLQLCHMIGELPEPTPSRMSNVVQYALSLVGLVYGSMALFGHIAFCTTEVKGDILTNFGDNYAAQTTRIGFTVAVLISFPFMVTPCRACVYSVLFNRGSQSDPNVIPQNKFVAITAGIVCITWFIAVTTPNVEILLSLTGAICGSIVCFIFPSLAYMALPSSKFQPFEWKPKVVLGMGMILLVGGSMVAMSERFNDEGAVAAIHELAGGAPDPVFHQLVDGRVPVDNEEKEGPVGNDLDSQLGINQDQFNKEKLNGEHGVPALVDSQNQGNNFHEHDKEALEEGKAQPLPVGPHNEEHKPNALLGELAAANVEEVIKKSKDDDKLDKEVHLSHIHNENAGEPESQEVVKPPGDRYEREKALSKEQEEVLGQQKEVLLKQEKVSDRQELVSDQLKVISDQQKQVIDQQKEVSDQQEQMLSSHGKVNNLNKEIVDLKNELSELKVQVSDLVSEKKTKPDESSTTIQLLVDDSKQKHSVVRRNGKFKLKGLDFPPAAVLEEKNPRRKTIY